MEGLLSSMILKKQNKDLTSVCIEMTSHNIHNILLPLRFKQPASIICGIIRHVASQKPLLTKPESLIRGVIDVSIHYLLLKQWSLIETHTLHNNVPS